MTKCWLAIIFVFGSHVLTSLVSYCILISPRCDIYVNMCNLSFDQKQAHIRIQFWYQNILLFPFSLLSRCPSPTQMFTCQIDLNNNYNNMLIVQYLMQFSGLVFSTAMHRRMVVQLTQLWFMRFIHYYYPLTLVNNIQSTIFTSFIILP